MLKVFLILFCIIYLDINVYTTAIRNKKGEVKCQIEIKLDQREKGLIQVGVRDLAELLKSNLTLIGVKSLLQLLKSNLKWVEGEEDPVKAKDVEVAEKDLTA